ncbi:MAG TPA: AAA family ATPase [Alcaligenes sp.]|nr:AAA family ATPase [Alcaligenes sp.]
MGMQTGLDKQGPNRIELYCLGTFRLLIDGQDRSHLLSYDKVKLLLTLLVLAQGQAVARVKLADMLWPESDPEQGRARVRHALHVLRQALAPLSDILHSATTGLTLEPDTVWSDILYIGGSTATKLDDARNKLTLYQGPFLDGFKMPGSDSLMSWHSNWNARLDIELAQCRHHLIKALMADEQHQAALAYAKTWVNLWPEDESCHRLLIRLLVQDNDRDAAMLAYQQCCDVMQQRLGVKPDAQTRALLGLGENTPPALPGPPDSDGYHFRAMATVAIAIGWQADPANGDEPIETDCETSTLLLRETHERVVRCAREHGAWIEQEHNATLLAHFGYPAVNERPVAPALALARTLAGLSRPAQVSLGLAIHADVLPIDPATPINAHHLLCQSAIALAWQAGNSAVLLSNQAAARLSSWSLESLPSGKESSAYQLRLSEIASDTGRIHGRLREFDILLQYWSGRLSAAPRMLLLHGHTGLGKTKLLRSLQDYVRNVEGAIVALQTQENDVRNPYAPVLRWLQKELRRGTPDAPGTRSDTQDTVLHQRLIAQYGLSTAQADILQQALSEPLALGQSVLREDTQNALLALLHSLCRHQTLLLTWEDLHWCDAASLQLLQRLLADSGERLRIVATSRQTLPESWPVLPVRIGALAHQDMNELINQRSRSIKLPRDIRAQIIEHSEGSPMLARELLHLYQLGQDLSLVPRLLDQCAAHLRRLTPQQRELAYLAALLPDIDERIASRLLEQPQSTIHAALQILEQHEWLLPTEQSRLRCPGILGNCLRQLIIRSERERLGRRLAEHMLKQNQAPSAIATLLGQVRYQDTVQWWQRAVEHALEQGQLQEAELYLSQALRSRRFIADPALRSQTSFALHLTKASLSTAATGPASPSSVQAFEQVSELSLPDQPITLLASLWGEWLTRHNRGQLDASLPIAEKVLRLSQAHLNEPWQGWSWYALAQHRLWRGEPAQAEALLVRALPLIGMSAEPQDIQAAPSQKPSQALAYASLGLCQAVQGRFATGLQNARHAITLASYHHHPLAGAIASKLHLMRIYYLAGNLHEMAQESLALTGEQPLDKPDNIWLALAQMHQLLPAVLQTRNADLIDPMQAAIERIRMDMPVALEGQLCMLARALICLERHDTALALLAEAEQISEQHCSVLMYPEIHCLRGDLWLQRQRPDLARQHWHQARESMDQHGLLAYEHWLNDRQALIPV